MRSESSTREAAFPRASFLPPPPLRLTGIVAAMPAEVRALGARCPVAGEPVILFEQLSVLRAGIGAERARSAAQSLVNRGARALMSWGTAAGLDPALAPGMLIVPGSVVVPGSATFHVDQNWHDKLARRLQVRAAAAGRLLAAPMVLRHVHQKLSWFEGSGTAAADMESGAVAAVAGEAGVPFLVVRAIADGARTAVPPSALAGLNERGELQLRPLLSCLARHPADCFGLFRLARGFQAARNTLRYVASRAGAALCCP